MADISKIKLPDGTTYDIKDSNSLPKIDIYLYSGTLYLNCDDTSGPSNPVTEWDLNIFYRIYLVIYVSFTKKYRISTSPSYAGFLDGNNIDGFYISSLSAMDGSEVIYIYGKITEDLDGNYVLSNYSLPEPIDTTYTLSISNNRITLTPSSGSSSYVDLPVYDGTVV